MYIHGVNSVYFMVCVLCQFVALATGDFLSFLDTQLLLFVLYSRFVPRVQWPGSLLVSNGLTFLNLTSSGDLVIFRFDLSLLSLTQPHSVRITPLHSTGSHCIQGTNCPGTKQYGIRTENSKYTRHLTLQEIPDCRQLTQPAIFASYGENLNYSKSRQPAIANQMPFL